MLRTVRSCSFSYETTIWREQPFEALHGRVSFAGGDNWLSNRAVISFSIRSVISSFNRRGDGNKMASLGGRERHLGAPGASGAEVAFS